MGKSETYLTTFDVSAVDYFDLVLDTTVQQEIHVSKDGLKMACWQASDGPLSGVPNGISRVVFSEPDLHIPKFLKKFVQKAQSYNEYSEFYPPGSMTGADGEDMDACSTTSKRKCVVVPHIGANRITMTFTEYYTEHEESTFENPKCLVRSEVFVKVRSPVIGRAMEQWILKTSREKVAERDRFVKRMLEKSKEQRRKNRRKNSGTKNEKWRRKFYSSQWFEEDSALEESTEGNFVKIETRKSSSEVKLESLESFPIVQKKKAFRRVCFFGAVFSNLIRLRIDDCFVVLYTLACIFLHSQNNICAYYE